MILPFQVSSVPLLCALPQGLNALESFTQAFGMADFSSFCLMEGTVYCCSLGGAGGRKAALKDPFGLPRYLLCRKFPTAKGL